MCFHSTVVFGWLERDRDSRLSDEWLESRGLECFFTDAIRLHGGQAVYGVQCAFDENNIVSPSEKEEKAVRAAFGELASAGHLGFHLAVASDASTEQHH